MMEILLKNFFEQSTEKASIASLNSDLDFTDSDKDIASENINNYFNKISNENFLQKDNKKKLFYTNIQI